MSPQLQLVGTAPGQADYTPYGNVAAGFYCRDSELILAGPRDTGKTLGLLHKLHVLACKYPGASIVIARKVQTNIYSTVLVTYQKKVVPDLLKHDIIHAYGGETPGHFDYPNGSRIWVAGLDKAGKVLSAEHDVIYVNQAEEITLSDWQALLGSATGRAGHMPYAQVIGDCNPSGPTHWIRQRHKAGALTFINTSHRDNPELFDQATGLITEEGRRRIGRLESLTGHLRLRWLKGLWVAPEGAIYSHFDETQHTISPFPIPPLWPRMVGIDPIGAYIAAVWLALDPVNQILHVYREYKEPFGIPTEQHAANLRRLSHGETIHYWVGGAPSERQQRLDFQSHGIPLLQPAFGDLWAGIDAINALLHRNQLIIHEACAHLLGEIADYRRDLKADGTPSETTIVDKDTYHILDSLRYAVVGPDVAGQQVIDLGAQTHIGPSI